KRQPADGRPWSAMRWPSRSTTRREPRPRPNRRRPTEEILAVSSDSRPETRPSDAAKDPLLQPLALKHLRLRNRIMSTSHACGLEEGGMPGERYQAYHEEKAKGGIALTMFGGSSNVAKDSPNIFRQLNVGD